MPLPDKCSDGSETSGLRHLHPPRALPEACSFFLDPQFSFRRVLSPVWQRWEEPGETRERGTWRGPRRRRSTTHRCTCRVMALPNNSNGHSPRSHESVLGTLGSVPGKVPGWAVSGNAWLCPGEDPRSIRPSAGHQVGSRHAWLPGKVPGRYDPPRAISRCVARSCLSPARSQVGRRSSQPRKPPTPASHASQARVGQCAGEDLNLHDLSGH
jgi:hypothetical protein